MPNETLPDDLQPIDLNSDELTLPQLQGERCTNLLCKGMYLNVGQPPGQRVTGDGNFWCGKTQTTIGPDRNFVTDGDCRHTGRTCYEGRE